MILTSNYVEYNSDEHFYYFTTAGAEHYTGKSHISSLWTNPDLRLENIGRLLHDFYTHSQYNQKAERYRNLDHIEYKVFKDEKGEVDAIIRALTTFTILADDMDYDLKVMYGEKSIRDNRTLWKPLYDAGVYFRGEYTGAVDEAVYRVGY